MKCCMYAALAVTTSVIVLNTHVTYSFPLISGIQRNGRSLSSSTVPFFVNSKSNTLQFPPHDASQQGTTTQMAAKKSSAGGGKKKRRRRKDAPKPSSSVESTPPPVVVTDDASTPSLKKESDVEAPKNLASDQLKLESSFDFSADTMAGSIGSNGFDDTDDDENFVLPDIRGALQRKEEKKIEEEMLEEKEEKKRISRKDTDAFIKVSTTKNINIYNYLEFTEKHFLKKVIFYET